MAVPYTFGTATASIPLSNLDSNFATTITLGNTAIQLGNTVTTLNNMTLANVAVTSVSTAFPNNLLANSSVTLGNTTVALGGTATTLGNVTLTNATVSSLSTAITVAQGGTGLTSTPANGALDIGNGTGFTRATLTAGSGISITNGAGSISIATSGGTASSISNGTSNVSIATSGGAVTVATNGNTAVTVDTSQNVGIGITTPDSSNKLQVAGDFAVSWDTNKFIGMKFAAGTSYKMGLVLNNSTRECKVWSQSSDSDDKITFYSGPTPSERMRITSAGNVQIGTTSISAGRLNVLAAAGASGVVVQVTNNGDYGLAFNNASGTNVGRIQIDSGSTSYVTSSDYRLKEDIAPMTGALAKVAALKPVTYKWKADGSDAEGFIAHELAEVCPQAVSGAKDAVDEEGNPRYQGIDTSFLVATLTAAIQEQQTLITSLTARIAALEAK